MDDHSKTGYCAALDGLRWFAFLGVFLYHADERLFYFGRYGVHLFFVLSGFLIGGILLSLKADDKLQTRAKLTTFYVRRSLRIFPLYYLVLMGIVLLDCLNILDGRLHAMPYHLTYTSNFYLYVSDANLASHTHFWTLCVEEHFYLIAPFALLLLSLSAFSRLICIAFVLCLIARCWNGLGVNNPRFEFQSYIQFDMLGAGMGFAILEREGDFLGIRRQVIIFISVVAGLALMVVLTCSLLHLPVRHLMDVSLTAPLLALAGGGLVAILWRAQKSNWLVRLLSFSPWVALGRISYGLYVYHNFMFVFARKATFLHPVAAFTLCLVLTILVATVSWHLLEKPILGLKRLFRYEVKNSPVPTTIAVAND